MRRCLKAGAFFLYFLFSFSFLRLLNHTMKNIVIFASGNGSNAENIIRYFHNDNKINVVAVMTDNPNANVLQRAKNLNLPAYSFTMEELKNPEHILQNLLNWKIDLIVLAGFLKLMPQVILEKFQKRIINIHPALLPKYGGKGMYGMAVHEAVKSAGENETGITIHYVNEKYDDGEIVFQEKVKINPNDTAESIAQKIHQLEIHYFPIVIKKVLNA